MESTRFTIFHLIWLIIVPLGAWGGWVGGNYFGTIGAVAGAAVGAIGFHIVFALIMAELDRRWFARLSRSTDEELRAIIANDDWKFEHTMALLNLSARGQEVQCELPRILAMLESKDVLTRRFGWDALRLVFNDETNKMGDYDPRGSTESCQNKTAELRATLYSVSSADHM